MHTPRYVLRATSLPSHTSLPTTHVPTTDPPRSTANLQYFKRPGAIKALVDNIQACNATWPSELLVNVDDRQDAGGVRQQGTELAHGLVQASSTRVAMCDSMTCCSWCSLEAALGWVGRPVAQQACSTAGRTIATYTHCSHAHHCCSQPCCLPCSSQAGPSTSHPHASCLSTCLPACSGVGPAGLRHRRHGCAGDECQRARDQGLQQAGCCCPWLCAGAAAGRPAV